MGRTGMMASISGCFDAIRSASDLPTAASGAPAEGLAETTSLGLVAHKRVHSDPSDYARRRRHGRWRGCHGFVSDDDDEKEGKTSFHQVA